MVTEEQFADLLKRQEDETLDFKLEMYDLSQDEKKFQLVKDILCMANTPRDDASYIVLGVKKYPDGRYDLIGLNDHVDESDLQSQFSERVYPAPRFKYEVITYKDIPFGIITILPDRIGPCVPLRDYGNAGNFLRQRQIYFRRGSKNELAGPDDVMRICRWIGLEALPTERIPGAQEDFADWERFIRSVHEFSPSRKYFLVTHIPEQQVIDELESLGTVDWAFVADMDPQSDQKGVLKAIRIRLEARRHIHMVVKGDRPTLNLDRGTYWFFSRGLEGSPQPPELGSWLHWQQQLGNELREQIAGFAKASMPTPVTVVALWYGEGVSGHLQSIFENALAAMGASVDFVIVTDNPADVLAVSTRTECQVISAPLYQICSGLEELLISGRDPDGVVLPSSSGAPITLKPSDINWIEEEIEIVHLNAGVVRDSERDIGRDFLRGKEITWHELGLRYDVERDQTSKLIGRVHGDLSARRAVRINLDHEPGAGGSTVARRVAWEFHRQFPCGILRRTEPRETIERLQSIVSLTNLPTLLLADGGDVSGKKLDELFEYVKARHLPVVILQVLRKFGPQVTGERTIALSSRLSSAECQRFAHTLSREVPQLEVALDSVATQQPERFRTPFYYCLQAFGKDFHRLDSFVSSRVSELTDVQKKILAFLSIAHHYGQKSIPAQAFGSILGIPVNRKIDLPEALSDRGLDLVLESGRGEWRTSHDLVATEILMRIFGTGSDYTTLWRQNLSDWSIEFASFCRGTGPLASDAMVEVARRTFLYRDNVELLGTERSGTRLFAQLIQDIPVKEGRLKVLSALADLYPDQPHFWAHLGRFHAIEMRDFPKAIECLDSAIGLQPDDSVLHHMKGMAWRSQATEMIEQRAPLDDVVGMAAQASESFGMAREKDPDDEHGYISEVQLISRVLDYAGRQHTEGLFGYLSSLNADPFVQGSLERSEDLLEQVRRNREGESPSTYEQDCRGKLDSLYGRYDQALQVWDNLLQRKDVYSPPIRRQIVRTYLARKGRSWDDLPDRELIRAMQLLEDNLNEEPNNDRNMRMWVQAVRRVPIPPSIESVIEKVAYWQANSGSIDSNYYMYVFNAVLALEGSAIARDSVAQYLDECRNRARLRRNRTKSFEWVGPGIGLSKLVHHSRLGDWSQSADFWENVKPLSRVRGRITIIRGSEAGFVEVSGGMSAFFVPAKGGFAKGRSENLPVDVYLGFSYDGLRAWDVKAI